MSREDATGRPLFDSLGAGQIGAVSAVQSPREMLLESVALAADGAVTLRGTGEFDDREVCAEALGRPAVLASVLRS